MATRAPAPGAAHAPVLKVTGYDLTSSFLLAVTIGLCLSVFLLAVAWYATRIPKPREAVPVELIEVPGGAEDGSVDETLQLESPADVSSDPSLAEVQSDETEVQETLDNVLAMADQAVNQSERQFEQDTRNAGKAGSSKGTGRRALGHGPGEAGFPREQRWFIRYSDQQTLEEYGRQLDFFGVELGAIVAGKLVYLSKLSASKPQMRTVASGAGEARLYMTWQGGGRKRADLQLFEKAGVTVGSGMIFQFYPKTTENQLAQLELAYKNRRAVEIRRTYFSVDPDQAGYTFSVTRQTYFK